jgi:hypothetical protein
MKGDRRVSDESHGPFGRNNPVRTSRGFTVRARRGLVPSR